MIKFKRTRNLNTNIKKLNNYKRELQKLCHEQKCLTPAFICPKHCCNSNLDISTAIIWKISESLSNISRFLEGSHVHHVYQIYYESGFLQGAKWILIQHKYKFNQKERSKILNAIVYATNLLEYIEEGIDVEVRGEISPYSIQLLFK